MGETTTIEWADATWNPVIGCAKVSPACTNCYAEAMNKRFGRPELWRGERHVTSAATWRTPEKVDVRAAREVRLGTFGRRLRLFVASQSDVFEDHSVWNTEAPASAPWARSIGVALRTVALRKLAKLKNVDVLLLTKRPENVLRMVPPEWLDAWPAHVWIGATVEDQRRADERVPHLLRVPARVRFLSVEPMLGPVDLAYTCFNGADSFGTMPGIHWVIAGGESGSRARPSSREWFRDVRDQCRRAGVPFLFKQWGEYNERGYRAGKAAAGRLLDGCLHDEYPEVSRG